MKYAMITLGLLFSQMALAQNVAFSCDNSDFHVGGTIVEDAHGYTFEVRDLKFTIKDSGPALNIRYGTSWATGEGRAIKWEMPDGHDVLLEIKDRGDTDYARARAVITAAGFGHRSLDMECAAATSP